MRVEELVELLEQFHPEAEVRIASGQGWAMEYVVATVETAGEAVYLAEGEQLGYLPDEAAVAVGWAEEVG